MSLREEMWRYGQLTGESAEHIPIIQLGAYLDGVDKGIEELEKIKTEIQGLIDFEESCCGNTTLGYQCLGVIDDKISELKGE